ncbi:MAG: hypothetical protein ACJ8OJ_01950 [Povalibacter sp.]
MHPTTTTRWFGLLLITLISAAVGDTPATQTNTEKPSEQSAAHTSPARTSCLSYCDASETHCSSEVRRARSECSKRAATQGRDPFTGYNNDYGYFCGYFGNGNACGNGAYSNSCRSRFSRTYGLCMSTIQQNVASMRYDCFQTERTAQGYCRDELRDCKAACPQQ